MCVGRVIVGKVSYCVDEMHVSKLCFYILLVVSLLIRPLLPGDTELDQIHRIFELLGCPSSRIWTDLPALKAFSSNSNCRKSNSLPYSLNLYEEQKKYPFSNLQAMFPSPSRIGDNGLECLNSMLTFDPKRRITVSYVYVCDVCVCVRVCLGVRVYVRMYIVCMFVHMYVGVLCVCTFSVTLYMYVPCNG